MFPISFAVKRGRRTEGYKHKFLKRNKQTKQESLRELRKKVFAYMSASPYSGVRVNIVCLMATLNGKLAIWIS